MSTDRRTFLAQSCACLGLLPALDLVKITPLAQGQAPIMSDRTLQHLGQGYWSADSLLLSAARHLKKPDETVDVAVGFGGGMQQKDLCGFLTGGIMAIGLFAHATHGNDRAAHDKCHRLTNEYWAWWQKNYPLHCSEISTPAQSCDYKSMGSQASAFLEGMFQREAQTPPAPGDIPSR
jgi:C_GCAxxG_C_C family probable redox protein